MSLWILTRSTSVCFLTHLFINCQMSSNKSTFLSTSLIAVIDEICFAGMRSCKEQPRIGWKSRTSCFWCHIALYFQMLSHHVQKSIDKESDFFLHLQLYTSGERNYECRHINAKLNVSVPRTGQQRCWRPHLPYQKCVQAIRRNENFNSNKRSFLRNSSQKSH